MSRGEVVAIWLKRFKRGPMDAVLLAEAVEGRGLAGNANQGGKRQITIIDEARWHDAEIDVSASVHPSARRANVMLRGIELAHSRGRILRLGTAEIRIYNETRPCEQMDEAQPGLRAALGIAWRGGVYGEIVKDGIIRIGDVAELIDPVT